ncbi:MAG TPA: ABC transporter transmembrane domain-containing protein, partial [bacterium]|nr:ABC transporter transmembrane domain-containing protein [bacterium]
MIMHRTRFPLVRQYDQLDCGPAALLSVLRYYGGDTTLVHARRLCRTDLGGTTLLDMLRAARAMGFAACGARGTYDDLLRESMPCIAHVLLPEGLSHYLVIYRIGTERLLVGDPGKGRYTLSRGEFETMWRERAVLLLTPAGNGSAEIPPEEAQADGGQTTPKAAGLLHESSPGWLRWIGAYLLQQRAWLQQILFTGVICTGAGLLTALFVQTLIDRLIPARATDKLLFLAAALLGVLILRAAIGYLRDRLLVTANKRLSLAVTNDFLLHLFRLPKDFFDSRKTGDITARIDDSLRIHRTCLLLMQSALLDFFLVLGALLFIFYFSSALGLLTLAMLPVYIAVLWRQGRRLKGGQREVMQSHAIVDSTWIDSIQGMPEIMSFNAAPAFTRLNQGAFSRFQDQLERLGLMQAGLNLMVGLLGAVISVSLLGLGAWQVMAGRLLLGQFMAAWSLLGYLLPAVTSLVAAYIEFQGAEVAAQRLMELLLVETEADSTPLAATREVVGIPDQKPEPQTPGIGRWLAAADPVQNLSAADPSAVPGAHGGTSPLLRVEALSFAWPKSPPLLR